MASRAAKQDGVVSLADARRFGATSMQLLRWVDRGLINRYGRRNFVFPGQPETFRRRLRAALNDAGPTAVTSHHSAALLHRFDNYTAELVEIIVPRSHRGISVEGTVHSSNVPLIDRCTIDGFACTTAARTIVDLSGMVTTKALEDAVDSGIRSGGTSAKFLVKRLSALRASGRAGVRHLDDVVVDAGGSNALERRFLRICREGHVPRPTCQVTYRENGKLVARVDFDFGGLIVEVDGQIGHASERQHQHDASRRRSLTRLGQTVYSFTYRDVFNRPDFVLSEVRSGLILVRKHHQRL